MDSKNEKRLLTEDDLKNYVTKHEMLLLEIDIKKEIDISTQKNSERIDNLTEKVSEVRDLVLPLIVSSEQTAKNTEKLVNSLEKFTDKQYETNSDLYRRVSKHDISLAKKATKSESDKLSDDKMKNSTKLWLLSLISAVIVTLIQVAPHFFGAGTP